MAHICGFNEKCGIYFYFGVGSINKRWASWLESLHSRSDLPTALGDKNFYLIPLL